MKIFQRYIVREVLTPFIVVITVLSGLFTSFNSARFLTSGAIESLGFVSIIWLILLKTLIALEVLIPIALYIAIIIGLGRLNKDYEMIVFHSVGISKYRIIGVVLMIAIPVGIFSGMLSIYVRPWAYAESYLLNAQVEAELNANRFVAGRFFGNESSGRVIYIQEKDSESRRMGNIFHYIRKAGSSEIVIAKEAQQPLLTPHQRPQIQLHEGYIYQLTHPAKKDTVINFDKMIFFPRNKNIMEYRRQTAPIEQLWESEKSPEIAELQWRLSRPVATISLALIAASLARVTLRQDKGNKTYFIAAILFAIYYSLSGLAQTWVEHGVVSGFPGVWWLYLLMVIVAGLLLSESIHKKFSRS